MRGLSCVAEHLGAAGGLRCVGVFLQKLLRHGYVTCHCSSINKSRGLMNNISFLRAAVTMLLSAIIFSGVAARITLLGNLTCGTPKQQVTDNTWDVSADALTLTHCFDWITGGCLAIDEITFDPLSPLH